MSFSEEGIEPYDPDGFVTSYDQMSSDLHLAPGNEPDKATCVSYWLGQLGEGHVGVDGTYSENVIDRLIRAGKRAGDTDWVPKRQ